MKRGWLCELVYEKTGEVIQHCFFTDGPLEGRDKVKGFVWRATEMVSPDDVVSMVMACDNIDRDARGWFARRVDRERGTERVGRGHTAWGALIAAVGLDK